MMKGYGMFEIDKLGWIEKDIPEVGPFDALMRPLAVAICTSDTHISHGGSGPMFNVILGHESVGEVVKVGSHVKNFKPGDVCVVPCCTPDWGEEPLQMRNSNNAHDAEFIRSFKFILQKDGVFAEYYTVNCADSNLVLKPESVSIDDALMATDMMSTGFYGAEMADINIGDTVVVFGIGPVGLMSVAGARARGAARIIAIGTRPNCIELAKEYGATDIVSYKEGDIVEQITALMNGGKVDAAIIAGGDASSILQALAIVKPNGAVSNVIAYDVADTFTVPAVAWGLGMSDVTIRSGFCPGGAYRMKQLLNMIENDRVHPGKMLNYVYEGFDKIPDAFEAMDKKPRDLIKSGVHISWD